MKNNVEAIHFHIKSRGVQRLILMQIMFQNCTTNFYLESDKDNKTTIKTTKTTKTIKTTTANLWNLLVWHVYTFLYRIVFNKNIFL